MKKTLIIIGILVALFFAKDFFIYLVKKERTQEYTIYQMIKAKNITEDCIKERVDKQICDLYRQTIGARIYFDASALLSKVRDKEDAQNEANAIWSNAIKTSHQILNDRGENFVISQARKDKEMCFMLERLWSKKIEATKFDCASTNATFSAMSGLWYDLEFLYRLQQSN